MDDLNCEQESERRLLATVILVATVVTVASHLLNRQRPGEPSQFPTREGEDSRGRGEQQRIKEQLRRNANKYRD